MDEETAGSPQEKPTKVKGSTPTQCLYGMDRLRDAILVLIDRKPWILDGKYDAQTVIMKAQIVIDCPGLTKAMKNAALHEARKLYAKRRLSGKQKEPGDAA